MRFRKALAECGGYGCLDSMEGFGGTRPWPAADTDPLIHLLNHSDCEGEIATEHCAALADRLEGLTPSLEVLDRVQPGVGHLHRGKAWAARRFAAGLREAAEAGEPVDFF